MRTLLKRPRLVTALTTAAALSLVLSGCSSIGSSSSAQPTPSDTRTPKAGGTLTVALSAEPDALDPTTSRTLVGRSVFTSICEKLYDINAQLQIVPQLAAAMPQFSADGLTVTIKLRQGIKFADGTTMDAAAVKTSPYERDQQHQ